MADNNPGRGRIRQAHEMDDEVDALSLDEIERRDEVLALQVLIYQELAAVHRQEERRRRQARERQQTLLEADERLARELDAEERGLVGAVAWDRDLAQELAREEDGDDVFNFGEVAPGVGQGIDHAEEQGDGHNHNHDHEHGHDHHHHDFAPVDDDREPIFVAEEGQDDDPLAEDIAHNNGRRGGRNVRARCTGCGDQHDRNDLYQATCPNRCHYCAECVSRLFRSTMTDEGLFPPRCCNNTEMPLEDVRDMLDEELARAWSAKAVEFRTPDRKYCYVQLCSTWIPPANIHGDVAVCPTCNESTCRICEQRMHQGDCPQDPAVQAVLNMAQEEGWQRCRACNRMVELNQGCNHMTCHCGHQFCYVCGERWKTCPCPQWHEERLLNRARVLVDRQPVRRRAAAPLPPPAPAPAQRRNLLGLFNALAPMLPRPVPAAPDVALQALRDDRIQRMAEQLRENANCAHPLNWMATNAHPQRRAGCELCGRVKNKETPFEVKTAA